MKRALCWLMGHRAAYGYVDLHGVDMRCEACGAAWYEESDA